MCISTSAMQNKFVYSPNTWIFKFRILGWFVAVSAFVPSSKLTCCKFLGYGQFHSWLCIADCDWLAAQFSWSSKCGNALHLQELHWRIFSWPADYPENTVVTQVLNASKIARIAPLSARYMLQMQPVVVLHNRFGYIVLYPTTAC